MSKRLPYDNREAALRGRLGVGSYVRRLREELDMQQGRLAELVGVGNTMVCQIEYGAAGLPGNRAAAFAESWASDLQEFALTVLSLQDPHLFAMIFPNAIREPLKVPEADLRRAMAIMERKARRRRA